MRRETVRLIPLTSCFFGLSTLVAVTATEYIPVYGGPTYDAVAGNGYPAMEALDVNNAGHAVGSVRKNISGEDKGQRLARWDSGSPALVLGDLGTNSSGATGGLAYAIDNAGQAWGYLQKYVSGNDKGLRGAMGCQRTGQRTRKSGHRQRRYHKYWHLWHQQRRPGGGVRGTIRVRH